MDKQQNWGLETPIPELEQLLDDLNRNRNCRGDWFEYRNCEYKKAGKLLGVKADNENKWNATIDALSIYRADFRGYTVKNSMGDPV